MKNKLFNSIIIILFLLFLGLYSGASSGVIDYPAKHKTVLTNTKIKEFEQDLENNEKIDLKKYTYNNDNKYDNSVSKATLKVSNFIGNTVKSVLDVVFGTLENAWEE